MGFQDWKRTLNHTYKSIVEWRRYLHQHPEPSFKEDNTRRYIKDQLVSFGYNDIEEGVGDGGIVAYLNGQGEGPTVGLRADFDALYIQEETGLPFASQNPGVMHACGHDGHTAILLGVAKVMKAYQKELNGRIKFIFQHAEEMHPGGATAMVKDGVMEDVDYVYGLHLMSNSHYGSIGYTPGFSFAASDRFDIEVKGKESRVDDAHKGVDPVYVATQLVGHIQSIVTRSVPADSPAVVTVSTIEADSEDAFKIPSQAHLRGTVRTFEASTRDLIEHALLNQPPALASVSGATAQARYVRGYPSLYNDPKATLEAVDAMKDLLDEEIKKMPSVMGAEDFAYFLQEKPGAFFIIPSGNEETGLIRSQHNSQFDLEEKALLVGARAFLALIAHHLTKDTLVERKYDHVRSI